MRLLTESGRWQMPIRGLCVRRPPLGARTAAGSREHLARAEATRAKVSGTKRENAPINGPWRFKTPISADTQAMYSAAY